jgi:hypothetical protein
VKHPAQHPPLDQPRGKHDTNGPTVPGGTDDRRLAAAPRAGNTEQPPRARAHRYLPLSRRPRSGWTPSAVQQVEKSGLLPGTAWPGSSTTRPHASPRRRPVVNALIRDCDTALGTHTIVPPRLRPGITRSAAPAEFRAPTGIGPKGRPRSGRRSLTSAPRGAPCSGWRGLVVLHSVSAGSGAASTSASSGSACPKPDHGKIRRRPILGGLGRVL